MSLCKNVIEAFELWCYRRFLRVSWKDKKWLQELHRSSFYITTVLGPNATHLIKPVDRVTDIHLSKTNKIK